MKIGIPTIGERGLDELVGEHFGRVPTYTIFDTETNDVRVIQNTSEHMGGQGMPPELLASAGANVLLCRGLGRKAIMMFDDFGIKVYVGADGTVSDAIRMWKDGILQPATQDNACAQHGHGEHGHGNCGGH